MKIALISVSIAAILVLVGGGVFLLSDVLNPDDAEVATNTNATNTPENENTNAVANTNGSQSGSAPGTSVVVMTLPENYPTDLYHPVGAEITAIERGEEKTRVGFFDLRPGNEMLAELRDAMGKNGWSEEFTVSDDTRQYTSTWTNGNRSVSIAMYLVNEVEDSADTVIDVTY